ncbi:MAG: hypothetical protein ACYC25_03840 [Paludibacter sp.]
MKRKLLYLIALFQIINIEAQNIKYGFELGFGTYQMSDLKTYMNDLIQDNVLQPKVVTYFPAYLYFQPSISFCRQSYNWGFNVGLMSTGARASIRDYSGEYRYDNKAVGFAPTFFEESLFYKKGKLSLYLHADVGLLYSNVQLSEYFMVNTQVYSNESIKLMSFGLFAKPVVKAIYPINDKLNIELNIGYHFDIYSGPLVQETDPITYFRYAFFQSGIKTQWNGIRIGLGCTYNFK